MKDQLALLDVAPAAKPKRARAPETPSAPRAKPEALIEHEHREAGPAHYVVVEWPDGTRYATQVTPGPRAVWAPCAPFVPSTFALPSRASEERQRTLGKAWTDLGEAARREPLSDEEHNRYAKGYGDHASYPIEIDLPLCGCCGAVAARCPCHHVHRLELGARPAAGRPPCMCGAPAIARAA